MEKKLNMISGQNKIMNQSIFKIEIHCSVIMPDNNDIDISAFLLNAKEKVSQDNDFIFYNNPQSKSQCINLNSTNPEMQVFNINLSKIPPTTQKIAFVVSIPVDFSLAKQLSIRINKVLIFQPETKKMTEKSLILGELYRYKDAWKFRAVGMGFQGGLAPLAGSYGVDVGDETPQKEGLVETPENKKIDLIKSTVNLKKSGEKVTINLSKGSQVKARLIWKTQSDLDLYCFYVSKEDKEDKVYYKNLGNLNQSPYIKLLGDSQVAGEEIIEISHPENVKYALLAAYSAVSNGIGSFHSYKAKIIVSDSDNQKIISHLSHKDPFSYWVAFALIDFTVTGKLSIKNVETYSNKKTFAKQFEQRTGVKLSTFFNKQTQTVKGINAYDPERSPYLFKDGSFMMSVGDVEFK